MNKLTLRTLYAILLLITGSIALNGQKSMSILPDEKVILFCDRNLYIAGEQILFSAFLQTGSEPGKAESSRVLYCELITPDGGKIAGSKYLIESFSASGYIAIPDNTTTGIYYIRAYTKSMRNYGPYSYHYTVIRIVNPGRPEVQASGENNYFSESLPAEENPERNRALFLISSDKPEYAPRETVNISINGTGTIQPSLKGLSLSVVPEFSVSEENVRLPENGQFEKRVSYYPETRGLSITGRLIDNNTGDPLQGTRVNLSVIGQGRDFMAIQTDTAGMFFFSLPDYTGYRDLFLCAENSGTSNPRLLVDNDFCAIPVRIPSNNFRLTSKERETAFKMAVNTQLESYFKPDSILSAENYKVEDQAFYGKPDEILFFDDYVQLPSLEEYFNELPTSVKVRRRPDGKFFKVTGTQSDLASVEPLILVDLVAINDLSKILAIPPTNISRIEIVNTLYLKGDQTYGGIISIITRQGDFAGIDLPSSGIFINYGFLAGEHHYPGICNQSLHTPDTRNTLFWEPQLKLNKENCAEVSFTASDSPGKYRVILKGVNLKGEEFRQTAAFEVQKY